MELLYMYVKKFGGFIKEQEIIFTNNFNVTLKDGNLKIEKANNYLSSIYSDNIKNISLMIGKNGTGKTTILDILGMNRADRLDSSIPKGHKVLDEYFLLYYLYKNSSGEDIYGIEYMGESILGEVIENCEVGTFKTYNPPKGTIGIQFTYDGHKFIDTNKHYFSNFNTEHDKLAEYLNIIYVNDGRRYSGRINYKTRVPRQDNQGYLAERIYSGKADEALKYKTIHDLKNNNSVGFINESAIIKIENKFNDGISSLYIDEEKYQIIIKDLKKILSLYKKNMLFSDKHNSIRTEQFENKETYILDLFSRYIIHQFVNGICILIEEYLKKELNSSTTGDKAEKNSTLIDLSSKSHKEFLEKLNDKDSSISLLGPPTDLEIEIQNLYAIIDFYNLKNKNKDFNTYYKFLISISRYLNSRIEAGYDFGESNAYQIAMEEFIRMLLKLSPQYFQPDAIVIPLIKGENGQSYPYDHNVYVMFEILRKYRLYEEDFHNDLNNKFEVHFEKLSEGENSLINIFSKVNYAAENAHPDGLILLLLDEPDCALHPEWSRKFFYMLQDILSKSDFNVQVVMTTHSPYMLSDVFPQNAYRLHRENEEDNNLIIKRLSELNENNNEKFSCFGANIFDLMQNSFFMNNSMGEFATQEIKKVINEISNIDDTLTPNEKERIEFFISNIGEPILKDSIKHKYEEQLRKIKTNDNYHELLSIISDPLEKKQVRELLERSRNRGGNK